MLDIRQVQAFVSVVEERSFTRAAERLHIGQSGLSQQIKKLERNIGGDLFERSPQAVDITDLGRSLYPLAQDLLASAKSFERLAADRTGRPFLTGRPADDHESRT